MTKHDKQLLQLLQASHKYLENPEDETKWLAFQKALETVEAIEKAETLLARPDTLKNPSQETNQILRRYYEEQLRPRNSLFLWSTILIAVIIGITLFGVTRGLFTPVTLAGSTATPTITASARPTRTPSPTITASATATRTPSPTITASATATQAPSPTITATVVPSRTIALATITAVLPTASPTITDTSAPTATATYTPSPTLIPTATATSIPFITTGKVVEALTNDSLSRQHIFRGRLGDTVTIQLNSQDFDPNLSIMDLKGSEIAANDDCGSLHRACIGPIKLPADGVYIVVVDSFTRRATGVYTLNIEVTHLEPALTVTPKPTEVCTATLPRVVIDTKESSVRLHNGPGQSYPVTGFVYDGECFEIIGRNSSDLWLQIRLNSGRILWVAASVTQIQGSLDRVPIATD